MALLFVTYSITKSLPMTITASTTVMGGTSDQDIMVGVLRNVKAIIFSEARVDGIGFWIISNAKTVCNTPVKVGE